MNYLITSAFFSGFGDFVKGLNGDVEALYSRFDIAQDIETRTDSYISFATLVELLEYSAKELDCPDFGIQFSKIEALASLGPVAVLARNSNTVEAAVRSVNEYIHLLTPALSVTYEQKNTEEILRHRFWLQDTEGHQTRQFAEYFVGKGQLLIQMLTQSTAVAERIYFPHSRLGSQSLYQHHFNCEVLFDQELFCTDIHSSIMQQAISHVDRETARIAKAYLSEHYANRQVDLKDSTTQMIARLLPTGHCNLALVAEQLGVHPRTLQRRLSKENLAFEDLVDEIRRSQAKKFLSEPHIHLTKIVGLLGYSDQSTLNRSCKRWFDMTPRELRDFFNRDK